MPSYMWQWRLVAFPYNDVVMSVEPASAAYHGELSYRNNAVPAVCLADIRANHVRQIVCQ